MGVVTELCPLSVKWCAKGTKDVELLKVLRRLQVNKSPCKSIPPHSRKPVPFGPQVGLLRDRLLKKEKAPKPRKTLPSIPENYPMDYDSPPQVDRLQGLSLLFLMWDDVLFPTTALSQHVDKAQGDWRSMPTNTPPPKVDLAGWRESLHDFLHSAFGMSDRVVLVSDMAYPWVTDCLAQHAPELLVKVWQKQNAGKLSIVYRSQSLQRKLRERGAEVFARVKEEETMEKKEVEDLESGNSSCTWSRVLARCLPWSSAWTDHHQQQEAETAKVEEANARNHWQVWRLMEAKRSPPKGPPGPLKPRAASGPDFEWATAAHLHAAQNELLNMCRHFPGRSHRNIICFGSSTAEAAALKALHTSPAFQKEHLRTKALTVPVAKSVSELTLRLRFDAVLLPALVLLDRSLDADLRTELGKTLEQPPILTLAQALHMPRLAEVAVPDHLWGLSQQQPSAHEADYAVQEFKWACSMSILCGPPRYR